MHSAGTYIWWNAVSDRCLNVHPVAMLQAPAHLHAPLFDCCVDAGLHRLLLCQQSARGHQHTLCMQHTCNLLLEFHAACAFLHSHYASHHYPLNTYKKEGTVRAYYVLRNELLHVFLRINLYYNGSFLNLGR